MGVLLLRRLQNLKRAHEVFGDQFVKRILHRENVILAKLDCTDQDDGATQNNVPVGPGSGATSAISELKARNRSGMSHMLA